MIGDIPSPRLGFLSDSILFLTIIMFLSFIIPANTQVINTIKPVENIQFSSPRLRYETNSLQPYGTTLDIAFSAFGIDFDFKNMELYTPATKYTDVDIRYVDEESNDQVTQVKMSQTTYRSQYIDSIGKKAYAIITINPENDTLFAVISQDDDIYYIQPREVVVKMNANLDIDDNQRHSLMSQEVTTVAYKASEIQYVDENNESYAKCGQARLVDENNPQAGTETVMTDVDLNMIRDPLHLNSFLQRQHQQDQQQDQIFDDAELTAHSSSFERELNLATWTSCLPKSSSIQYTLNVNFVADVGFFNIFKSQAQTESYIQNIVNTMNDIFATQMGFTIHVSKLIIFQSLNSVPFNKLGKYDLGSTCANANMYSIDNYLDDFTAWIAFDAEAKKYKGQWHAITNCFPPAGTVGLAYVNATCHDKFRTGVSSYTSTFYEVVIHELGHNLGSSHAWEYSKLPQGKTGGCMDYNVGCRLNTNDLDGPGENGFHRTSERPICDHLSETLSKPTNIGTTKESCWTSKSKIQSHWTVGTFANCSSTDPCIKGTKTRPVYCVSIEGVIVDEINCTPNTKPATSDVCFGSGICPPSWSPAPWSSCTSTHPCLEGIKTRIVNCVRSEEIIPDHNCPLPKPPTTEVCKKSGICYGQWKTSSWESCSSTSSCRAGQQFRDIFCRDPSDIATIDNSFCQHVAKPLPSQICYAAGTCTPTIGLLAVDKSAYEPTDTIEISWILKVRDDYPNSFGYISLRKKSDISFTIVMTSAQLSDNAYTYTLPTYLGKGNDYYLSISAFGFVSQDSPQFSIGSSCPYINCKNGSTCDDKLALCTCASGYSGVDCSQTKCSGVVCNNGGTCSLDSGKCNCPTSWSGPTCDTKDSCLSTFDMTRCDNRGFISTVNEICSSDCICYNNWETLSSSLSSNSSTDPQCNQCPLQCNVGKPDATCSSCECPIGVHGNSCICRHLFVSFKTPVADWMKTDINRLNSFIDSVKIEVSTITSLPILYIEALSPEFIDNFLQLRFRFLSTTLCPSNANIVNENTMVEVSKMGNKSNLGNLGIEPDMILAYEAANTLSVYFANRNFGTTTDTPILSKLVDLNQGIELVDTQCSGNTCPKSIPPVSEETPSKDGLSTEAIIGIAVGGGVLLIIIIVIICCCCVCKKKSNAAVQPQQDNTKIQMTAPQYTHDAQHAPVRTPSSPHHASQSSPQSSRGQSKSKRR